MADGNKNRIEIALSDGLKLVAEQNTDSQYSREMFIGVEDATGAWLQDLAVVRNSFHHNGNNVVWNEGKFDVLVSGSEHGEGFTEEFSIELQQEETDGN